MKAPASRVGYAHASNPGLWARLRNGLTRKDSTIDQQHKHSAMDVRRALGAHSFIHAPGKPVWMGRDYERFADEGFIKNVIAHRAVSIVASGAAHVPWLLYDVRSGKSQPVKAHPVLKLLNRPNPFQGGAELFESIYASRLIAG
ncbi:MAG: phage portal protein, partial [Alphaproteobacteria bacterium]|nr:phage portal protein [Alphaproteobacteria bacterium]